MKQQIYLPDEPVIAGVDEAGRGPLAGPVIAAAVILDPRRPIGGLADSKALSEKMREKLFAEIRTHALAVSVARARVSEIDEINILHATLLAMQRAVTRLTVQPTLVLIDGNCAPALDYDVRTIIKGDVTESAISAASIVAKVVRDRIMRMLDKRYPAYGFAKHKGYGTRSHLAALAAHGVSRIHRLSFSPVSDSL